MVKTLFKKISNDLTLLPHKGLFITLFFIISLFATFELTKNPLFRLTRADEINLPQGYTALEYVQALGQADVNNDGVINLFDYAVLMDQDYGKQDTLLTSDINYDQRTDAVDASFMLNHFYTDVNDEREKIFASEQYMQEVNKEIALRNEDAIPGAQLEEGTLSVTSEEGGSEPQYGRTIIPKVLGTVSAYTGAAAFSLDFQVPAGPGGLAPSLSLGYSSASIDDARNNGSDGGKPFYTDAATYMPFQFGYGFSLGGIGSIVRDTKEEKEVYKLKGNLYHRYILNLPGGVSAELKYNPTTGRWASIPQSFLKIEHKAPGKASLGALTYLDPWDWQVTTKDGTTYYFGEENVETKLNTDARIIGSEDIRDKDGNLTGTKNGNLYIEFDKAHLCKGSSERDPCSSREDDGKVLIVTKWLLRKVETPDGRAINYTYDTQQRYLEKPWKDTSIAFVTATSYPKEINWNDNKHRVTFVQEDRPDKANNGFMNSRIKEVVVETKKQDDNQFHLVRKYALGYFDINTKTKEFLGVKAGKEDEGIENEFKASFLTSVQEFGTDGTTALPPTTFRYAQYAFPPQGYHGGEIYLATINNGYGGETRFAYQAFGIGAFNPSAKVAGGKNLRVRVIQKEVADLVTNKSAKETYTYGDARMFAENFRKAPAGEGGSAEEFLGHASVEIKQFDFDGSLLSHNETFFNQANFGESCFEPHAAKGQPYKQVVYRGDSKDVAQETNTVFRYRFNGKAGLNPSDGCSAERRNQPIFLYAYDTINIQREPVKDFVPQAYKGKVQGVGKSEVRTLQRVLAHDEYGNQTLGVSYGEVDKNGIDVDKTDNRYSYAYYLTSGEKWIKGLPFLSYASNVENCTAENVSCQWGRTRSYYDNFTKNYWELSFEEMQPKYGFLSQKETWIDDTKKTVEGYEYWDISRNPNDTDERKAGIYRTYGPKPNLKEVKSPREDLMLISEKTFDTYYHTLMLEEKNALGYVSKVEDYDVLLQLPRTLKNQTQKSPVLFATSKMEFDALGRLTAQFTPNPERVGETLAEPAKIMHFFERGNEGLVVRSASLVSQAPDGAKQYQVSDSFYDGLGQVRQNQVLSTLVDGKDVRKVSDSEYHADGKTSKTFEVQTTGPVSLGGVTAENYKTILTSVPPQYVAGLPRIVNVETTFDSLRRPVISSTIETGTNQKFTSTNEYGILSSKSVDPKGIEKITLTDVWGRGTYGFTQEASKQKSLMTVNEYGKPMLDKATKTTIVDNAGASVVSTFDYDESGRLITSTDPSLGQYKFEYDIYGNKILEISQPREDVGYEYDVLGRLVKRTYYSLASGELYNKMLRDDVVWTYDQGPNGLGKLTKVEHLTGSKEFVYDGGQRVVETKVKTFDNKKSFTTTYNVLSQEVSSTYPDSTIITKEYDREGRVQKMKVDGKDTFTGAQYDKFGNQRVAGVMFEGAQYSNTNTFDTLGRLTNLGVSKNNTELFKQDLSYNSQAEITSLNDVMNGQANIFNYTYDGFSQLTAVNSSLYNSTYEYDLFGRMLQKKEKDVVTMSYSSEYPFFAPKSVGVNESGNPQRTNISYTKEGGMQNDVNNCYFYNREGELTKLQIKKDKTAACTEQNATKVYMFYYDEGGAMNLQEEYNPANMSKPLKQVYLFGMYEEEVTN